jgi:mannose-1-phosphate guanylyltransferase
VLALGHKAAHFRRFLGDGRSWKVKFIYSLESVPLGTGGAIRNALKWVQGPTLILNGDVLCDLDLDAFVGFHKKNKAEATLSLVSVPDPSAFGLIETEKGGRIRSFLEKPSQNQISVDTINAGHYLFEPSIFNEIPAGRAVSVEREVFPGLLQGGRRLFGYHHKGYWSDIGTLKSYHAAHGDLLRDTKHRLGRSGGRAPGVKVDRTAVIRGDVLLGPGCRIGAGAVLEGFVCVGAGAVVEERAVVVDSVLHARCRVGAEARVESALVGEGARIGAACRVGPGVAVAPASLWKDYSGSFPVEKGPKNG